jgi:CRP/FNR family transcriptional regulator, cyclic AMP receptor protein
MLKQIQSFLHSSFGAESGTPAFGQSHAKPQGGIQVGTHEGELACQHLCDSTLFAPMTVEQAQLAATYFVVQRYRRGATLIEEGDTSLTHYLLLILEGEVAAETVLGDARRSITLTVLEPGGVLGEMSFLDGQPRSATCRADTEVLCAALSREALLLMTHQAPEVAAKLMMLVALRMAQRLRNHTTRIQRYSQLFETMQERGLEADSRRTSNKTG